MFHELVLTSSFPSFFACCCGCTLWTFFFPFFLPFSLFNFIFFLPFLKSNRAPRIPCWSQISTPTTLYWRVTFALESSSKANSPLAVRLFSFFLSTGPLNFHVVRLLSVCSISDLLCFLLSPTTDRPSHVSLQVQSLFIDFAFLNVRDIVGANVFSHLIDSDRSEPVLEVSLFGSSSLVDLFIQSFNTVISTSIGAFSFVRFLFVFIYI